MKRIVLVSLLAASSAWGQVVNPPTSTATATNVSGGSAGAQPYQTAASKTSFVYPSTDASMLTLDINRTDSYTEDGTIERPYKNIPTLSIPSTGLASIFVSPNAGYSTSTATTIPTVPVTVYGNNSTWTFSAGVTNNALPFARYDLNTVGTVTHGTCSSTIRNESHGGSYTGNLTLGSGCYDHLYGVNLSGNSYTTTVNGLLYGEALTGSQSIVGNTGSIVALYNPNMTKSSGYNVNMNGGQLLLSGGLLSTGSGPNIYLPTANTLSTLHAISGLIVGTGTGVACVNGTTTYVAYGFNLAPITNCTLVSGYQGPTIFYGQVSSDRIDARSLYSAAGTPLPTCSSTYKGSRAVVSDATTPTYMGAYTSGGGITAEVICSYNGTTYSWLTH